MVLGAEKPLPQIAWQDAQTAPASFFVWKLCLRLGKFRKLEGRGARLTLRVQVPNKHIVTPNLYYNYYYPNSKYLKIGYMDP